MKKTILLLGLASALLYGCSNTSQAPADQGQTETVEASEDTRSEVEKADDKLDQVEDNIENKVEGQEVNRDMDEASLRAEAIDLVADDLGVTKEELVVLVAEVDQKDDDVELDVYYDGTIYEYEVERGAITEKELDIKIDKATADELMTGEDVLKIALEDAGLSEADLIDYEIELDEDNGVLNYEVELDNGTNEFEYKIDARSGEILEKEMD